MNNRIFAALSVKPFFFLWVAEIFSQIAINMVNFVLIIVAFKLTKSNTGVAGIVLSFTVPAILFGLFAGVYVDRWNKKTVLFLTNLIRTFLLVTLAVLPLSLPLLFVLSFLVSVVTQFFIPAETPIIPILVERKLLLFANALFGMGIYGSVLIAYLLSGPFIVFFGERYVFLILAIFFAIAAIFVSFIKIPKKEKEQLIIHQNTTPITEMRNAFSVMVRTKEISQSLFLLTLSQLLVLILAVLGPGFASQILRIKVDEFPLLFVTPSALGMVMGAVAIGTIFHAVPKPKSATIGLFLAGFSMLCLPYGSQVASRDIVHTINMYLPPFLDITILHIMVFLAFLLGFANALVFVPSNTLLQEKTTDEFRGKAYGALNALVGTFSLIPIVIVGELADILGVGKVITSIGIILLSIGIMRLLFQLKIK